LSFDAVAATVADAVLDHRLDPIALGLSGPWGSGKTTVLELVRADLESRNSSESKVLVIPTQPWRYDPAVGPKESLIAEVLDALSAELKPDAAGAAKQLLTRLVGRVNWAKALKVAAKAGIALQLPSIEDVLGLIKDNPDDSGAEPAERGLAGFRDDFQELLQSEDLKHISRVVVLVDDLDRCLPETVVETLEAIRLFLSARGMSFVIAADEDRVADAIQQRIQAAPPADPEMETPAKLYLHKIVQTTIPLPGLSRFDTQAYLLLLLAERRVTADAHATLTDSCAALRRSAASLDELEIPAGIDLNEELAFASRLTPILYEKFRGNPRRIKRFLNDLSVRQAVSERRGIQLPPAAVAKLMVLERLLRDDFETVLEWLAKNQLRDQLEALDRFANSPEPAETAMTSGAAEDAESKPKKKSTPTAASYVEAQAPDGGFTDTLVRWAKLSPTLDATDVSAYLYLAASFVGIELIDDGLPERLRDVAAALTSSLRTDRSAVSDDNLKALSGGDARILITYLGRQTRDQPGIQSYSVNAMLRLTEIHPGTENDVVAALKLIPLSALSAATVVLFNRLPEAIYGSVLAAWDQDGAPDTARRAIQTVRDAWRGQ
jgi:hypothetical protein